MAIPPLIPPDIDLRSAVAGRLDRLRTTMVDDGIDVCVLTNPVSMRYATGYRSYAMFQSRIPTSAVVVPVEGDVVLLGADNEQSAFVDRTQSAVPVTTFDSGLDLSWIADRFVGIIVGLVDEVGLGAEAQIGIERATPSLLSAFSNQGLRIVDAEPTLELARSRKTPLEMPLMMHSIAVAELGMAQMSAALRPGMTENELWAILHHTNISHNGDWIDGRMLASGPRSNPWLQEASARVIEAGDLVAFDTDMIGPFGYCADISRTFLCGATPSPAQVDIYARALEEIEHNTSLLHVGASFDELSHSVFRQPDDIVVNRYPCAFHGVGMSDEYPKIPYPDDWRSAGYDGEIEDGLLLCVESYVGREGQREGVKLEQMVQVSENGVVEISTFPFWDTDMMTSGPV